MVLSSLGGTNRIACIVIDTRVLFFCHLAAWVFLRRPDPQQKESERWQVFLTGRAASS